MQQPFGGFDVIMYGDMRQLPTVRASEVYKRPAAGVYNRDVLAWHHLDYFPLTQVVRQSDAVVPLLAKIGGGRALTDQEVRLLNSRFVTREEASAKCSDAVRLYFSNTDFDAYNESVAEGGRNKVVHMAPDDVYGHRSPTEKRLALERMQGLSRVESGNLPASVAFCLDKPYMLLKSVDVSDGLVNGMVGTLQELEYNVQGKVCRLCVELPA
ncbi:hypothetical protein V5799_020164 [Amblyomma americanum]|uniref:DNA helicase n=1 Tax=Amblyomma americanum TaxID=6943 RepID=A0AAQ4EUM2_AMBAM